MDESQLIEGIGNDVLIAFTLVVLTAAFFTVRAIRRTNSVEIPAQTAFTAQTSVPYEHSESRTADTHRSTSTASDTRRENDFHLSVRVIVGMFHVLLLMLL